MKGFTLIWTGDDDRRRDLVISAMRASFAPFGDAVLPDVYGDPDAAQSLDLMAGLEIRKPDLAASGFYVGRAGAILTAADTVASCSRITIDDDFNANVVAVNQTRGLALLQPEQALAPIAVAQLASVSPRLNSEIAVAGYSYGGLLGAPSLTFGILSDLRGLDGDRSKNRLTVATTGADAGGPVLSGAGAVLGLLLPPVSGNGRRLPEGVGFLVSAEALAGFLAENGVDAETSFDGGTVAPEDLSALANDMTVLVSCWN